MDTRKPRYFRLPRYWAAFVLGVAVLLGGLTIGCSDQSELTGAELAAAERADRASDASTLVIEPDVVIDNPRHFLVHRLELPPPVQDTVGLKGQFEVNHPARRALVRRMRYLINPASKVHDGNVFPIVDEDEHLTAYRLRTAQEPVRQVWLENQFGQQTWTIGQPRFLYTPAQKEGHAFPDALDHYKCYEVLDNGGSVDVAVDVGDQFIDTSPTVVRGGRFFCVPVQKRHGDKFYDIHNAAGHLAVYRIDPIPMDPIDKMVRDQFDERDITAYGAVQLVTESRKLAWQEID